MRPASLREWNQQSEGPLNQSLGEEDARDRSQQQFQEAPPEEPHEGLVDSPLPSPTTPADSPQVTPLPSLNQPESENVPPSPHISTPASLNPPEPQQSLPHDTDMPLPEPIDLDEEDQEVLFSAETMTAEPQEEIQEWLTYHVGMDNS